MSKNNSCVEMFFIGLLLFIGILWCFIVCLVFSQWMNTHIDKRIDCYMQVLTWLRHQL